VQRISETAAGVGGNSTSGATQFWRMTWSPTSDSLLFRTFASNLVAGDTNASADILAWTP
jgi:hypothetical protein